LAHLQQTIKDWMSKRGGDVDDVTDNGEDLQTVPEGFSGRFACSEEFALNLTSELLGDFCTDDEDAEKRYECSISSTIHAH
jgi:hypothetical protein